jgi:NADPH:quinone reductase-like Zn-dependent oxidoreductase
MKAVVHSEFGAPDVLRIAEIDTPAPKPNELLVKVHAGALNPLDWHLVRGAPFPIRLMLGGLRGPKKPRVVGADFAGTVEAAGPDVTGFAVGDAVFGTSEGTLAEYLAVPADKAALKPERITFEQAAGAGVAALTALQMVRDKAGVRAGQRILIVGAGGGIGTFAVQIAKSLGAHVTGVQSTGAIDLVRSLGADAVIDYTREDFAAGEARYDAVLDNVSTRPLSDMLRVLKRDGVLVPNGGGSPDKGVSMLALLRTMLTRPFISQRIAFFVTKPTSADLRLLAEMMQSGAVTPVVDTVYPLADAAEAMRHLEAGHPHGKIVVSVVGRG